jgi:tRNA U55 pseudouridine synthase TruB
MVSLDRLELLDQAARGAYMLPTDSLLSDLNRLDLDDDATQRLIQGQRLSRGAHGAQGPAGLVRLYRSDGELLGTGSIDERGVLAVQRLVAQHGHEQRRAT